MGGGAVYLGHGALRRRLHAAAAALPDALLLALAVDAVSAVVMGYQVLWHLHLVLTGRTSLADDDDSYDAGRRKNWEHVFGTTRLWPLPLKAGGPTCDGFTWPECEAERKRE